MKNRLLLLKNKWQVPFHLGSAFLPACLLIGAYASAEQPWFTCIIAMVYLACVWICLFLPDKVRLAGCIASVAAILYTGIRLLLHFKNPALVLPPILYAWLMIETLPMFGKDCREELPPYVFVMAIVLHLIGQAALFIAGFNGNPMFEVIRPGLSGAFVCFFLLTLLNFNRSNLIYVAAMEKTIPRHIYRFNRVLTILLAAITIFVGCIPAVVRLIKGLWNTVIKLIADLIAWFNSLLPVDEIPPGSEAMERGDPMVPYVESETSLLAKILEVVLYVLVAAVAVFVLWILAKYIKRFVKWLWKRIQEYVASTGTGDYVDEISDTRESGERRRIFGHLKRRHDPLRGINERKLAPGARIRFYYLRLLLQHKDWKSSRTARENLPEQAAAIYERARYSVREITESDAQSFLELTTDRK